jgi:UDP-N-acetyl-D-glucosamine dehydrogenase
MPEFAIRRMSDALNKQKKVLKGSRVLALGLAYKRDIGDIRDSAALDVVTGLVRKGVTIAYSDPHVPQAEIDGKLYISVKMSAEVLRSSDCVVILTDHSSFDYSMIVSQSSMILDCRNALREFSAPNVISL